MYVQHPYKFEGKYYAKIDGVFYEISKEEDLQMEELQDLKIDNEKENTAKKKDKKWKRKTKRCEILDCAFSANSDGLSVADMADDTQLSLEELMILKEESKKNKTVRVLKLPKTESSIRKVFLPKSVAEMLVEWKKGQDKIKELDIHSEM